MKTRTVISLLLLTLGWGTALRAQVTLTGVMQTGNEDYAYYNTAIFLPDGSRAMVTDPLNSRVIVFDPRQYNRIITTIPTGLEPAGIYLSPDGLYACVLNIDSETVTIISLSDYATATYTPPNPTAFGYWNNIAFSPDGKYGLVCNAYTNTPRVHVFRISVESSTLHQATLTVGQDPARIYMYGDRAYVVCTGGSSGDIISVLRYNGSSFSVTGNYTFAETDFDRPGTAGYTYNNIAFSADGTTGYIGNPLYNEVIAFDLSNPNIQSYIDLSDETEASISRLAMSPDGLYLMATSIVTEQIFILDPASLDLLFTVEDSAGLLDIDAFNNIVSDIDGYTAYIASVGSDEIMHFDFTTGEPIEYIPAGSAPETLARSADGRFLTAVNVGQDIGDTVSIFSLHPKVINIPFFRTVAGEYTGYAVSNPSAEPLTMVAFANTSDGQTITGDNNPAIETLSALNQLPFIGDQLFGLPAGQYLGWLQLICNNDAARAFFLSTNYEGDYMDGTVASDTLYFDFFLTHLREQVIQGQYRIKTELFFANPYSLPVELSLEVRDRNGTVLATLPEDKRTLAPGQLLSGTVRDLFFRSQSSLDLDDAYIYGTVTNQSFGVVGFSMVSYLDESGATQTIHSLPLQLPADVTALYCPHLANGGRETQGMPVPYNTVFHLVNTAESTIRVTFTMYDDTAGPGSGDTYSTFIDLDAGQMYTNDAWKIFDLPDPSTRPEYLTGNVVITTDQAGIIGDVVFTDGLNALPDFESCLILEQSPYTQCVFSHVANGPAGSGDLVYYNGISIANPTDHTITVDVAVYGQDGTLTGTNEVTLTPNTRLLRLLNAPELVPDSWGQLGGYVVLTSQDPFVSFELFIDNHNRFMSAIPRN